VLKIRVMPTLLYKDVELVKGVGFDSWRRVGAVMQAVKVYNLREVDELVFLDIEATRRGRPPDFALVDEIADECFMPLTVGGGVRSVEDVRGLLQVGADKVAMNTAVVESPGLVRQVADRFGSQCVVVSIDARRLPDGRYEAFIRSGTVPTGLDPVTLAGRAQSLGAGEILLTSVERDGTMEGYDIELTRRVSEAVSVPVIASGGAGKPEHFAEVLRGGKAAAVAAASCYHFTELTPREVKNYLREQGFAVRI
jgi:cyclase